MYIQTYFFAKVETLLNVSLQDRASCFLGFTRFLLCPVAHPEVGYQVYGVEGTKNCSDIALVTKLTAEFVYYWTLDE